MKSRSNAFRLSARERPLAWLVTGPVGRLVGFIAEAAIGFWHLATHRDRPRDR